MQRKQFTVDPAIITHLISSQAGTIEKAVLECYMNSVDAKASQVDINIDKKGEFMSISDNGHGWRDEAEIESTFGNFGFDHGENNTRTYGHFGLGRGQLWNYCSATYFTNTFKLHVDIRKDGLDYGLETGQTDAPGCRIDAVFYQPLDPRSVDDVKRALKEWLYYAEIPVLLNGELISHDPAEDSWTTITDEAYIKSKENGSLVLYNQGVFVTRLSAYEFGFGGVVVSRKPLKLNMARNDVLRAECPVWPNLRKALREIGGEQTKKNTKRLNDAQRHSLLRDWLSGEVPFSDVASLGLLVDARGRSHKLGDRDRFKSIGVAPERGARAADRAIAMRICLVLAPQVIEWAGVRSADELKSVIVERLAEEIGIAADDEIPFHTFNFDKDGRAAAFALQVWRKIKTRTWDSLCEELTGDKEIIPPKGFTKRQKMMMAAASSLSRKVAYAIQQHNRATIGNSAGWVRDREIRLGESDTAQAWTDGETFIAIDSKCLSASFKSADGLTRLASILLHEYTHDSSSADDTHAHSQAFFEDFHDMILSDKWKPRLMVDYTMRVYGKGLSANEMTVPRWVQTEGRIVDDADDTDDVEDGEETTSRAA